MERTSSASMSMTADYVTLWFMDEPRRLPRLDRKRL
jgi:hypothetical protein